MKIRRALISVADKTGLVELARSLARGGVEILSTGGTARALRDAGLAVTDVSEATGHPEILGGRVKTLHPKVHGGILARRALPQDLAELEKHGIRPIDLVVANLYPFEQAAAREGIALPDLLEEIDIGGVALLRAAAKSFEDVVILSSPDLYSSFLEHFEEGKGDVPRELRIELALAAFARTSAYDEAIGRTLSARLTGKTKSQDLPERLSIDAERAALLRYGENPHQRGALYRGDHAASGIAGARILSEGKALSYNNILDLDSALGLARDLEGPGVVVLKHASPCGAAEDEDLVAALEKAWDGDPLSAFGSVLGINRPVTLALAEALAKKGFIEAAIAPSFDDAALEHLLKKPKWGRSVRLLALGDAFLEDRPSLEIRAVSGGFLVQDKDRRGTSPEDWRVVSKRAPTKDEEAALRFAWRVVKHVRSNAIALAKGRVLVGAGGGLPSRVDSVHVACRKAGERAKGAALASDAFFPFPDGVEMAASHGVTAIVQPGGSVKDKDVISAADALGLAMVVTGARHFRH